MKTALKLLLSLALTVALFVNTAYGLSCITCDSPSDTNCIVKTSLPCVNGDLCFSAIISATTSNGPFTQIIKGCAAPSICPAEGTQDFSLDVSSSSVLGRAECCSGSDDCNSADASTPTNPAAGSLQCYGCDPLTNVCSSGAVTCNSLETNCFSSTVRLPNSATEVPAHGCASQNLCAAAAFLATSPLLKSIGSIQGTCCTTDNCNPLKSKPSSTFSTESGRSRSKSKCGFFIIRGGN
uniref:UPAR/Ly6 domain-containing protein n=1 Tax=Knipowitschia caucasica TaxID=637954 RepID=A0AAV2JN30_KNICA